MSADGAIESVVAARHRPPMRSLATEMTLLGERWAAARHRFYERWAAGALTHGELQLYASEHDHLVVAIATVSKRASAKADGRIGIDLRRRADDDDLRVGAFRRFARATGWGGGAAWHYGEDPLPQTVACVLALIGGDERTLAQDVVALSAIDAALGVRHGPDVTGCLEANAEDRDALLTVAERVHRAHWALLDGIEQASRFSAGR